MAVTIGGLVVNLVARTQRFTRGMRGAKRQVGGFAAAAKTARAVVAGLGAAVATLGAARLVGLAKSTATSIDQLSKMSQRLGITIEDLSRLQFVAQRTGVEFNQFAIGVQRMTRRIAEAAMGTGEAQEALKQLGVDVQRVTKLAPDKQFREIAEALSKVEGEAEKVRLVFKLFDSEGVALKNTLALNADEFDKLIRRADQLGTITRSDAMAAAQFKDALTDLSRAGQKFLIPMMRDMAVLLSDVTDKLIQFTAAARIAAELTTFGFSKELFTGRGDLGQRAIDATLASIPVRTGAFTQDVTNDEPQRVIVEWEGGE